MRSGAPEAWPSHRFRHHTLRPLFPFETQQRSSVEPIMGTFSGQRGLSLVEMTIILLVMMLLTGVVPSVMEFVNDAKRVRVKTDCQVLGSLTAHWHSSLPAGCLKHSATAACTLSNRVDILFGEGPDVTAAHLSGDATTAYTAPVGSTHTPTLNWSDDDTRGDSFEHQFVSNHPAYELVVPQAPNLWPARPPQTSSPITTDPWGSRYLINTVFLSTATNATAGSTEGLRDGTWLRKVFCLSAGANGVYETSFGGVPQPTSRPCAVDRVGDDYFYPIGCMNP